MSDKKRELPEALRKNADKLKRGEPLSKGKRETTKKTTRKSTK